MPTILLRRIFYHYQSHLSFSLQKKYLLHLLLSSILHPLFLRSRKGITLSKRFIDYRSIGAQFKSSNRLSLSLFFSMDEKEIRQYKSRLSQHCSTTIMRLFVIPAPTDQIFLISWILAA